MDKNSIASDRDEVDVDKDDRLEDTICYMIEDYFRKTHEYDTLCSDKEGPLYMGCINFTRFSMVLRLFNLKKKVGEWIKVSLNFLNY